MEFPSPGGKGQLVGGVRFRQRSFSCRNKEIWGTPWVRNHHSCLLNIAAYSFIILSCDVPVRQKYFSNLKRLWWENRCMVEFRFTTKPKSGVMYKLFLNKCDVFRKLKEITTWGWLLLTSGGVCIYVIRFMLGGWRKIETLKKLLKMRKEKYGFFLPGPICILRIMITRMYTIF